MKYLLRTFAAVVALALSFTIPASAQDDQIRQAVIRMLEVHPQSTLQDIYKSCFQDVFGPGHLINDSTAARRYLHHELEADDYLDSAMVEPTGIHGNYVRVNLMLVKNGTVSEDDLLRALIESANNATPPSQTQWRQRWGEIIAVIKSMNLDLPGFEADSAMLDRLLSEGKYVMHHSPLFDATYHPHYRIILKSIFDTLTQATSHKAETPKTPDFIQ